MPSPFPGGRRPRGPGGVILPQLPQFQWPFPQGQGRTRVQRGGDERVNVDALREITDDSGGRTEIVRSGRDLDPATANIADELSRQVLSRLLVDDEERRPLARDSRRNARQVAARARAPRLHRDAVAGSRLVLVAGSKL